MQNGSPIRLAVIGGGISGLAGAYFLQQRIPSAQIVVYESKSELGGVLQTELQDGFLIEHAADNFITTVPWAVEFCRQIGFEEELCPTNPHHRRAFVVRNGKLRAIPPGFVVMAPSRIWPVVATPILSPLGKLRLAGEWFVPRRSCDEDESLASFVTRRFGRETYERLVQPLVAGIYTADPEKLSLAATMPRFIEMEREHGSLIRALRRRQHDHPPGGAAQASGARYSQFVAPRRGMSSLIEAIAQRLTRTTIARSTPVVRLGRLAPGGWRLELGGQNPGSATFDGILLATPATHCARLLRDLDAHLADDFAKIEYGSCGIVTLGYARDDIRHPLDGFGFVVPQVERRQILSASFSSVKYPGRAPDGKVLLRVYVGGAAQRELLDRPDDELLEIAQAELAELLGIQAKPLLRHVARRLQAMPQYHVGHPTLAEQIHARIDQLPCLTLAGNALQGVGIPHCIHSADGAAQQLTAQLSSLDGVSRSNVSTASR